MSSLYFQRYHTTEVYSALLIINAGIAPLSAGDIFLRKIKPILLEYEGRLQKSFAFHEQESLARRSDAIVHEFARTFRKMRDMAAILADSEAEYGARAVNAQQVISIINRHDSKLYNRSKDEMINLFDSIALECEAEKEDSILVLSDIAPLITQYRLHIHLHVFDHALIFTFHRMDHLLLLLP